MAKIVLPTYITKQPSNGKNIEFRPFTVKEEKALLLALQEETPEAISTAIKNIVSICTDGAIDAKVTPYYDVEYVFLQIRAKSVGEVIDLVGSCECGPDKKTNFSIDIDDTRVEPKPVGNVHIKIVDTQYTVEFRHPSIDDFVKVFSTNGEYATNTVANCMVNVYSDEEVMDWSYDEKLEFVESMTSKQQIEITAFLKNMPMVKLPASYKCKHCGKEHDQTLSGFSNFFV